MQFWKKNRIDNLKRYFTTNFFIKNNQEKEENDQGRKIFTTSNWQRKIIIKMLKILNLDQGRICRKCNILKPLDQYRERWRGIDIKVCKEWVRSIYVKTHETGK